jgi:hypothetical protein
MPSNTGASDFAFACNARSIFVSAADSAYITKKQRRCSPSSVDRMVFLMWITCTNDFQMFRYGSCGSREQKEMPAMSLSSVKEIVCSNSCAI